MINERRVVETFLELAQIDSRRAMSRRWRNASRKNCARWARGRRLMRCLT